VSEGVSFSTTAGQATDMREFRKPGKLSRFAKPGRGVPIRDALVGIENAESLECPKGPAAMLATLRFV
jgi:hypothetical protein